MPTTEELLASIEADASYVHITTKRMQYDQSIQAHDAPMPQEVLSAKTIAVIAKVIGGPNSEIAEYKQRIQASAIAEIEKHNRFQLVSDPAKADLVCLLIEFSYDYWREAPVGAMTWRPPEWTGVEQRSPGGHHCSERWQ